MTVKTLNDTTWTVPSRSNPDEVHVVKKVADGSLLCDCTAVIYGRSCWHVKAVADEINREVKWHRAHDAARLEEVRAQGLAILMGKR